MVLWQHVVLCKGTLLRMCLAVVCVVCYVVRDWLSQRNTLRTSIVRRILYNVPLHNTTCCHSTRLI